MRVSNPAVKVFPLKFFEIPLILPILIFKYVGFFLSPLAKKYNENRHVKSIVESMDEELNGYMLERLRGNPQKMKLEASTDVALTYFSNDDSIKKQTLNGESLLHLLARDCQPTSIKYVRQHLLHMSNLRTEVGSLTPLHIAIRHANIDIISDLLDNCDYWKRNNEGRTAFHYLPFIKLHSNLIAAFECLSTSGIDILKDDPQDRNGFTIGHVAFEIYGAGFLRAIC